MTVALYSANYGRYDAPKAVVGVEVPCVLYTDNPDLVAPGWEVRVEPLSDIATPMLRAKWWKTHPGLAVGGDVSIWIDSSMTPLGGFTDRCVAALGEDDISFTPHPWRDCIYDELEASVGLPKYNADAMREQCSYYEDVLGHPRKWGLFASGAMVRRHTPDVLRMGEDWWTENALRSWQDQLSLPVVLRATERSFKWNSKLPWAQWWGYTDHGVGV